jgi:hypothetical protein
LVNDLNFEHSVLGIFNKLLEFFNFVREIILTPDKLAHNLYLLSFG